MYKREREQDIFRAGRVAYGAHSGTPGESLDVACDAAVRRAYEIDGVGELVEAAGEFCSPILDEDECIDALERLRAAIAHYRQNRGE